MTGSERKSRRPSTGRTRECCRGTPPVSPGAICRGAGFLHHVHVVLPFAGFGRDVHRRAGVGSCLTVVPWNRMMFPVSFSISQRAANGRLVRTSVRPGAVRRRQRTSPPDFAAGIRGDITVAASGQRRDVRRSRAMPAARSSGSFGVRRGRPRGARPCRRRAASGGERIVRGSATAPPPHERHSTRRVPSCPAMTKA